MLIISGICGRCNVAIIHTFYFMIGDLYLQKVANSRQKIAQVANPFIRDGTVRPVFCVGEWGVCVRVCMHVHVCI